ncbi:uncharacterized protein LOC108666620 isoform X2 [Hyalella azteca]|nr:uncharacterized protein LOC108666620 isoform X2 [Hyalella azteca]
MASNIRACCIFLVVILTSAIADINSRAKKNEIPHLSRSLSSEDIRKSQKEFFNLLGSTPGLSESKNVSNTIQILNTLEGQKLMRKLVDSLVPTIGRDDSGELLHNFWMLMSDYAPDHVAEKLKQIENLYGEIDSLPAAFASLMTAGSKSPIALILQEVIPNFNASELLRNIAPTSAPGMADASLTTRLLHLFTPAIDTFLKENNIDLQTDAIVQMVSSLTSQFQGVGRSKSTSEVSTKKSKSRGNDDPNPLSALLPLLGMMGTQGKNGNKMFEGLMGMLSNGGGENIMENLSTMLGSGGNKNNLIETVMGMLNSGKTGDNNAMGMMMSLINGMNNNKKENANFNMIASVMELMSAGSGGEENNPMASIAKMAIDMIGKNAGKKSEKLNKKDDKTIIQGKIKPHEEISANSKKEHKEPSVVIPSSNNNQRSRLLHVLEPALLKLHTNTACHAKLGAVMSAAKTMLDTKTVGVKGFLSAALPVALAGLPGGPALLQEIDDAINDLGIKNRPLSDVLASIADEGECVTLARRAAPHVGRLVLLLAEPEVQQALQTVLVEPTTAALDGLGLKGVTLSNWPQILGPMISMGAAGLPVQPVPLLTAAQEHITELLRNATQLLKLVRGQTLEQVTPKLEYELGSMLHHLGGVEHLLSRHVGSDTSCIAQVVCRAAEKETGIAAAILTSYSAVRGLMTVS